MYSIITFHYSPKTGQVCTVSTIISRNKLINHCINTCCYYCFQTDSISYSQLCILPIYNKIIYIYNNVCKHLYCKKKNKIYLSKKQIYSVINHFYVCVCARECVEYYYN